MEIGCSLALFGRGGVPEGMPGEVIGEGAASVVVDGP